VKAGKMTEAECFKGFLDNFELYGVRDGNQFAKRILQP
jgi:hypothetical protein